MLCRICRAHARMLERSLSRSPSPSRRPINEEDKKRGGKHFVASSPVKKVRVKTSPHKVKQPIEVVGSNGLDDELEKDKPSTASDENARAAVYNPKRWQNKFFTGQGVTEKRSPVNEKIQKGTNEMDGNEPRRKVPVLSNVRPPPTPPPQNTLHDFIKQNMNDDNTDCSGDLLLTGNTEPNDSCQDEQDRNWRENGFVPPSSRVGSNTKADQSAPRSKKQIDLETEEYEFTPSAREFLNSEEGIKKQSLEWKEEQTRKAQAKEQQQREELCGNRVDNCVENIVRILLSDIAQNPYHEENVTQGRVRVHALDHAQQTIVLKGTARERRIGMIPPSKKEAVPLRGSYYEDMPHNSSLQGESVCTAFETLHQSSDKLISDQNEFKDEDDSGLKHRDNSQDSDVVDSTNHDNRDAKGHIDSEDSAVTYLHSYSTHTGNDNEDDSGVLKQYASIIPDEIPDTKDVENMSYKVEKKIPTATPSQRVKTPKEQFEKLQSHSILPSSESAPSLTPQVIGLVKDSVGRQKQLKRSLRSKKKSDKPSMSQSVENINLNSFEFPLSSQHVTSHDHLLSHYDDNPFGDTEPISRQKVAMSVSGPLFPPIVSSRPTSNDEYLRKSLSLAERVLETKEETQSASPLGNGKPYEDKGLYVSYTPGTISSRSGARSQSKGPPPVSKIGKGNKTGKSAIMQPMGGGAPVLAGLRKLTNSTTASQSLLPDSSQEHDSKDIVLGAYAAAMGLSWNSNKNEASAQDHVTLRELLAAVEESRVAAPLFSQQDTPGGLFVPPTESCSSSICSVPEILAPLGNPLDPNSSAGIEVNMQASSKSERMQGLNSDSSAVLQVSVTRNVHERNENIMTDDEPDVEDEEAFLEEELRAMLQAEHQSSKHSKRCEPKALATKKPAKVKLGKRLSSSTPAFNNAEKDILPALVVGATKIPKRRGRQRQDKRDDDSDSMALSLNSCRSNDGSSHSAKYSGLRDSGGSVISGQSSGVGKREKQVTNTPPSATAALLAKYAPTNNLQLAASLNFHGEKGPLKKKDKSMPRKSSKKTLSTLESNAMGLDASSLLEKTMADYEEE